MKLAEARTKLLEELATVDGEGNLAIDSQRILQLCDIVIALVGASWEEENEGTYHWLQVAVAKLLMIAPKTLKTIFEEMEFDAEFQQVKEEALRQSIVMGEQTLTDLIKEKE